MDTPMATRDEIQREMESIRSMRRISSQSGPGSIPLDPDLPGHSVVGTAEGGGFAIPGIAGLNLQSTAASGDLATTPEIGEDEPIIPSASATGGAFFWVPASLHPELAPSEFKQFLRDHRRDVEEGSDPSSPASLGRVGSIGLQRSSSGLSRSGSGLGRQKSMLSRQYQPREGDEESKEGDDEVKPIKRNRSSYIQGAQRQLTIKDLQALDNLATAVAAGEQNAAKMIRSELRRSISLGFPPNIIDQIDNIQEDEENAPVIVPQKALQRTARTRIRKPNLEGDGGGHRFASSRRGKRGKTMDSSTQDSHSFEDVPVPTLDDAYTRPTSDVTTSDRASLSDQEGEPYARPQAPSPEPFDDADGTRPRFVGMGKDEDSKRESLGESIYDAYTGEDRDSVYYDARESTSFEQQRVKSPGAADLGRSSRNGIIYDDEDEPFFSGGGLTSPVSPDKTSGEHPSVILRPHSPEKSQEQLPLTQAPVSPPSQDQSYHLQSQQQQHQPQQSRHQQRPSNDIPQNPYGQQQHLASSSNKRSFVKEYGYQQQFAQPLPPSQMYQQPTAPHSATGLVHPTPKKHLDVPSSGIHGVSPPSSPEPLKPSNVSPNAELYNRPYSAPPQTGERPTSADKKTEKEKEKGKGRGLFGWGGKDKEKEKEKEREKEKEKKEKEMLKKKQKEKPPASKEDDKGGGGLFGIFGGSKKKQDDSHQASAQANAAKQQPQKAVGPFAAASPVLAGQYARYPLHVERAVYRLSHIKLANPRRPLYEQVLISNLMFWYLGIINKPVVQPAPPSEQVKLAAAENAANEGPVDGNGKPVMTTQMSPAQQAAAAQAAAAAAENARLEQEQREKEERERELAEQAEHERMEREQKERMEREKIAQENARERSNSVGRKGKGERPGMGARSPGYEHQYDWEQESEKQKERPAAGGRPSTSPAASKPTSSGAPASSTPVQAYHLPVRVQNRPTTNPQQPLFYQQDMNQVGFQPINPYALPPGAKPPATVENTWAVTSNANANAAADARRGSSKSPPPGGYYGPNSTGQASAESQRPRPSRSPPPHDYLSTGIPNGARPARSLSANASKSGPTSSGSFPPSSNRDVDYDRDRPSHHYSQSANAASNGAPPSGSSRLQKKKSSSKVTTPTEQPAGDGTKPTARRRKSLEAGAGDRRGIIEPDVPFETMWNQYQSQMGGYGQQAQMQGQQGYTHR